MLDNSHWKPSKLDSEHSPFFEKTEEDPNSYWRGHSLVYCGVLLAFGLSLLLNTMLLARQWKFIDLDTVCSDYTTEHKSPVSDKVDIKYLSVQFDGSFTRESVYTLPPSDEVERAWNGIGTHLRHTVIPEHQAQHYGLDTSFLKLKLGQGGGYPVLFEFQHHLHCLNLLRQTSWFNFKHYNATQVEGFQDGEEMVRKHIGHCVNQLRQVLMCNPDLGLLGQVWVDEIQGPFVQFNNTRHKCKNWDEILRTASELQVPKGTELKVEFRDGDIRIPSVP